MGQFRYQIHETLVKNSGKPLLLACACESDKTLVLNAMLMATLLLIQNLWTIILIAEAFTIARTRLLSLLKSKL